MSVNVQDPEEMITEKQFLKLFKQHLKIVKKTKLLTKKEIDKDIFHGLCPFRQIMYFKDSLAKGKLRTQSFSDATMYYIAHKNWDWQLKQEMRTILAEMKWK
jgi:hypothetical protein